MTTVVIDASAALSCCFDDEAGAAEDIDALAEVAVMLVPGCFLPEVANALLSGARRGRMTPERAVELLDAMLDIRWHVDPEPRGSTREAADLAIVHGLTAYDASYLALAKRASCPLVTRDAALAAAARAERVPVATLGR
jgi:predicted nucleic acid-binding protein